MASNDADPPKAFDYYAIDNRTALLDEAALARGIPTFTDAATPLAQTLTGHVLPPTAFDAALNINGTSGPPPTTICVFCGSSAGNSPAYAAAARDLARVFHENNIQLVYGGGTVGLMGEIARTLVSLSGPDAVHGIIPAPLVRYEQGPDSHAPSSNAGKHGVPDVTIYGKTTVVDNMHTRKQMMAKAVMAGGPGSGFIALPGGYGTLEELMEVVTWNQLGIHGRGTIALNVDGYWDGLLRWVDTSIQAGFVRESNRDIIVSANTADDAVRFLADYKPAEGRFKLEWGTL